MPSLEEELRRLRDLRSAEIPPPGWFIIDLAVLCPESPSAVLGKVKDVLVTTIEIRRHGKWLAPSEWARVLPGWFVQACRDDDSREEAERWLEAWRRLAPAEQAKASSERRWSLADWLYWFAPGPDERQWRWWRAEIADDGLLRLQLAAEGWPTAYGALEWLLRASGAQSIDSIDGNG